MISTSCDIPPIVPFTHLPKLGVYSGIHKLETHRVLVSKVQGVGMPHIYVEVLAPETFCLVDLVTSQRVGFT